MPTEEERRITVTLTESQFAALSRLSKTEQADLPSLVSRGVDTVVAIYCSPSDANASLHNRLASMEEQILKLLVSIMKLVGQAIYFASMPITVGTPKTKVNEEMQARYFAKSREFAYELLVPTKPVQPTSGTAK